MQITQKKDFIKWLEDLTKEDIPLVGGKCANLGELSAKIKVPVPPGFAVTAKAFEYFIKKTGIGEEIYRTIEEADITDLDELNKAAGKAREIIETTPMPDEIKEAIVKAYEELRKKTKDKNLLVAVRSSATAEDLPGASFAGQQDTYLNVTGEDLLEKVQKCWGSLFTPRATMYRVEKGFRHEDVLISVAVQQMVNSRSAGVMFTLEPTTGERDKILINSGWGLGEAIVSGKITPDEFLVDKNTLKILKKDIAKKTTQFQMDPATGETKHIPVEDDKQEKPSLTDEEVITIAKYGKQIEDHYGVPQDIEWAIDQNNNIYILQSRPETIYSKVEVKEEKEVEKVEPVSGEREILLKGLGVSPGIGSGPVKVILDVKDIGQVKEGDVIVTEMTTPDWVPAMKKSAAIVTNSGGKTCHAAIVSRELGIPCIVGTGNGTEVLDGVGEVTVDGTTGVVYRGRIEELIEEEAVAKAIPVGLVQPTTATKVYVNLSIPEIAEKVARDSEPDGVGLLRAEHLMLSIGKHPRLLIEEGGESVMIERFAEGIRQVAEAFYPKPVVYRFLDFKPDEFLEMPGGEKYELEAGHVGPNPMIGYRGQHRYLKEHDIFRLELRAIRKVREEFGLTNVWVMLPFVRKVDVFNKVVEIMREEGLDNRVDPDFQLWIMVEVPSSVFLIEEFCKAGVDGISFGTNDLTMLILGVDRNDEAVQEIYDERDLSVLRALAYTITVCKKYGVTTSICGQAPSVYPDYLEFLIRMGATSISVNPDSVISARKMVSMIEKKIQMEALTGGITQRPKIGKHFMDEVFFWRFTEEKR
ncbi:MAG: phosphoenolpyruvate synthase [Candidatus Hydrothermarchaeota archaeon]